jgi:hypothetical protein
LQLGGAMNNQKAYIIFLIVCLAPFVSLLAIMDRTPLGPELNDKQKFYGCYSTKRGIELKIKATDVLTVEQNKKTKIKRMFFLKENPVINTKNNIFFKKSLNKPFIGTKNTGFFYPLKEYWNSEFRKKEIYLSILDENNSEVLLKKTPCST